jgi:hypothetical protein
MLLLLLFVRAPRSQTIEGTWPGQRIDRATYPYTLGLIHIFAIFAIYINHGDEMLECGNQPPAALLRASLMKFGAPEENSIQGWTVEQKVS